MSEPAGTVATNGLGTPDSIDDKPGSAISIAEDGDLVINITHPRATSNVHIVPFRVSSRILAAKSKYFERLLETGRFGEGEIIAKKHAELHLSLIHI